MLDQVMATLETLTPAEKRVGKLVIENPRRFASMSTSDFARGWAMGDSLSSSKSSEATGPMASRMSIPQWTPATRHSMSR